MTNRFGKVWRALAVALGLGFFGLAHSSVPILVDPDGAGTAYSPRETVTLDWQPGNMLIPGGISNLQVGQTVRALVQARLAVLLDVNGVPLPFPPDKEWTYVASVPLKVQYVVSGGGTRYIGWEFDSNAAQDPNYKNFMEIWKDDVKNSNDLAGTGFNDGTLIMTGLVTNVSQIVTEFPAQELLDQFQGDDYAGQKTLTLNGSQSITVNVTWPHPDYFPGFTPDLVDTITSWFNTSNITPYRQANPSAKFLGDDAGTPPTEPGPAPNINPSIGAVNGLSGPDLQAQADPNQSFEFAKGEVPGACRVTYGGNDRNGNIDPHKFGEACSPDGRKDENCYTFGGQAGAPSATSAKGGPFGEHTHHQKSGPAGDFVFHAGTNSAPKNTRIEEIVCKDPGACRQAVANASFKQIDFDGTGSFRVLDATAKAYLEAKQPVGSPPIYPDPLNTTGRKYYFRVDMNDLGEPGSKWGPSKYKSNCQSFFAADQNNPLSTDDPIFTSFFSSSTTAAQACSACPDVYQIRIYSGDSRDNAGVLLYEVRAFLTGGNIQIHRLIR